jgi:hypothetical protein
MLWPETLANENQARPYIGGSDAGDKCEVLQAAPLKKLCFVKPIGFLIPLFH